MPKLVLVPTPIGNLEDITLRAINTLKSADFILSEDTRVTKKLLNHLEISNHLISFHQHNEHKVLDKIIEKILDSEVVAQVSDAGTPAISDPGFLLVRECLNHGIEVECLPGPTAFIPALVKSGFPSDRFVFEGFLPQKKGRQKRINELLEEKRTIVLYESPYRILKALEQFREAFGNDRMISVSRELTKLYEETFTGTIDETIQFFEKKDVIKGEFVVVIRGVD